MQNKTAIDIVKSRCTGCSGCAAVCPVGAISFRENKEGFYYPQIDRAKCTGCNLCIKACPAIHYERNNKNNAKCFSGWAKNQGVVRTSSSGGIFFELAKEALEKGYSVVGVIMENKRPRHVCSDKLEIVNKMRGSKYLQSYAGDAYKEIIKNRTKKYFFTGTPCQVAAINNLKKLYKIQDDNIITCDIVCHGVPSFKLFDKYLKELGITDIKEINFRDKSTGWGKWSMSINSPNKNYKQMKYQDSFYKIFLSNLAMRSACFDCPYAELPRLGDITLADFWGVEEKYKNNLGTSAIMINNKQGEKLFSATRATLNVNSVKQEVITENNHRAAKRYMNIPKNRNRFLANIDSLPLNKNYRKNLRFDFYFYKFRSIIFKIKKFIKKKLIW